MMSLRIASGAVTASVFDRSSKLRQSVDDPACEPTCDRGMDGLPLQIGGHDGQPVLGLIVGEREADRGDRQRACHDDWDLKLE